jgi:hypothetical protein
LIFVRVVTPRPWFPRSGNSRPGRHGCIDRRAGAARAGTRKHRVARHAWTRPQDRGRPTIAHSDQDVVLQEDCFS